MPTGCNLSESITICRNTEAVKRARANYISCSRGTFFNIAPDFGQIQLLISPKFSGYFQALTL